MCNKNVLQLTNSYGSVMTLCWIRRLAKWCRPRYSSFLFLLRISLYLESFAQATWLSFRYNSSTVHWNRNGNNCHAMRAFVIWLIPVESYLVDSFGLLLSYTFFCTLHGSFSLFVWLNTKHAIFRCCTAFIYPSSASSIGVVMTDRSSRTYDWTEFSPFEVLFAEIVTFFQFRALMLLLETGIKLKRHARFIYLITLILLSSVARRTEFRISTRFNWH